MKMKTLISLYLKHRKLSVPFLQRKLGVEQSEAERLLLDFNLMIDEWIGKIGIEPAKR